MRVRNSCRLTFLAIWALSLHAGISPETGSYVFRNYAPTKDYPGTPDNWMVVQDKRGVIYVANTSGVLEFDGNAWQKISLNGVHSLGIDDKDVVYAGGTGDFGRIEHDSNGTPRFASLLPRVPLKDRQFNGIWRVLPTPRGVYFSANERIFRLNSDGSIATWNPMSRFGRAVSVSGALYVKTPEQGLVGMRGEKLTPVPGGEIFAKAPVEDAISTSAGALIATADRLYRMTASGFEHFETSDDGYFAKNDIYAMNALPDGTLAVGTRTGGLVMLNLRGPDLGRIERIVTKADGLPDNYISSITSDRQGGIWLTSSSGITFFNPGLTRFNERQGIEGDVLYSIRHGGAVYAGTRAGLFRMETADGALPGFERVTGIAKTETVLSLLSHSPDLLAATGRGVYRVSGTVASQILETRHQISDLSASLTQPDTVYAAERSVVYRLRKMGSSWQATAGPPMPTQDFQTILEDTDGKVWATTKDTIWRFDFDQIPVRTEKFGAAQGVPAGNWINAWRFKNHIVFATSAGLRQYSERGKRFAQDISLGTEFTDGSRDIVNLFEDHAGNVWVTGENDHGKKYHGLLLKQQSGYKWRPAPLVQSGIDEIYWMSLDDNGTAWATGSDGVLFRWDPALSGDPDRDFNVLTRRVQVIGENDALYGGEGTPGSLRLPYRSNALRFEFAAPFFEQPEAVEYQVMLDGADRKWSLWSREHFKEYNSISEGSYRLRVRARSPHGTVAEESAFAFDVLAPWYRTGWAYGVYAVFAALGVWGIVRWRVRQLEEDKRQLEVIVEERTVEIRQQRDEIHVQERKSHSLLLNILPAQVADELKATGSVKPVGFDDVTVCFTDFVGFTLSSEKMPPDGLVNALNEYFTAFDEIIARYRLEKLKTIGDSYMFVSGLPVRRASHAVDAVLAALEMADVVKRLASKTGGTGWNIRIGLHSGPVVAGVVGIRKFAFDIWGNTVNFAARMESSGVAGRVNISERTCRLTRELIDCESRGNVRIKEGRELPMFLARGVCDEFAARYRREFGEDPISMPDEEAMRADALGLTAE